MIYPTKLRPLRNPANREEQKKRNDCKHDQMPWLKHDAHTTQLLFGLPLHPMVFLPTIVASAAHRRAPKRRFNLLPKAELWATPDMSPTRPRPLPQPGNRWPSAAALRRS
jgi:hypothetical protein